MQQSDLAEQLGVTRMTISRLERGQGGANLDLAIRAISACGHKLAVLPRNVRLKVETDE